MRALIHAIGIIALLAVAIPALAEHSKPAAAAKSGARIERTSPSGFVKYCGAHFGCYTGIPLQCSADTRPYQNIAEHQCFCLPDGCR